MASKKYTKLLIGLLCLFVSSAFAQDPSGYNVQDSSVIPAKRLPQHTEFMANNQAFPAKPRNQWELGIKGGLFNISGDVRSRLFTPGVGIHVRKALGYVFSLRGEYTMGWAKGLNFSSSTSYSRNRAWSSYSGQSVFYNYKTNISELSLQGVVTLTNIRFHKAKTGFNVYGFAGLGGMIFDTKINAYNDEGGTYQLYNFGPALAIPQTYDNRKDIRDQLKDNILDDTYETHPEEDSGQPDLFNEPFRPVFVLGAGIQFKLSNRVNLAIEDKFSIPKTDLLDGQQWQENGPGIATAQSRDYDTYNFFSVGLNVNLGAKSVEPLWWINPLDYAYNEINKPNHMKLPKPVLDDADGDGITDQFDNEPNTPAGTPVDIHVVSRDTDGDGVPGLCRRRGGRNLRRRASAPQRAVRDPRRRARGRPRGLVQDRDRRSTVDRAIPQQRRVRRRHRPPAVLARAAGRRAVEHARVLAALCRGAAPGEAREAGARAHARARAGA